MKIAFLKIKKQIYFIPIVYSLIAIILSVTTMYLDVNFSMIDLGVPKIFLTEIELGKSIFTSLIGALLTMITVTFSTMMVVLTLYSSQLSPRSIQDFLEEKFTTRILGYMSAVFVFSIVSLYAMKDINNGNLFLSPFIGIILAIITIFSFIYFIHQVSKSVRVNIYVQKLTQENIVLIEEKYLENIEDNGITNIKPDDFDKSITEEPLEVKSNKNGFIQLYEDNKLLKYALDNGFIIICEKAIGEFIVEDSILFSVHNASKEDEETLTEELNKLVVIGEDSNKNADMEAGLKKLVEVGVKALSPGINDPSTAIYCIENLGFSLSKIGTEFDQQYFLDQDDKAVLVVENTSFVDLLYKVFYQLSLYGKDDNLVIGALIEGLGRIAESNNHEVKTRVWRFAKYIIEAKNKDLLQDMDKSYLNKKITLLAKQANQNAKELYL